MLKIDNKEVMEFFKSDKKSQAICVEGYRFNLKIKEGTLHPSVKIDHYGALTLSMPYRNKLFYENNLAKINQYMEEIACKFITYPKTKLEKYVFAANNDFGKRSIVEGEEMFYVNPQKIIAVAKVHGEFYNHETDKYTMIKEGVLIKYIGHEPKFVSSKTNSINDSGFTLPDTPEKECLFFQYYSDPVFGYNGMFGEDMYLNASSFDTDNKKLQAHRIDDGIGNHIDVYAIEMLFENKQLLSTK